MRPQTFQHPEIRDENDNIIQPGAFGKNTPFCTKGNDGILDFIANDLEYLYKKSVSADNDDLKAKSLAVSGTSDLNLVNADTVKAKSLAVTGTSAAPTAPTGDSSKTIANTEFVQNTVSGLVGAAPETLDTLNELATALGNDPNFATTVSNQIGKKANQSDLAAVSTKVDKKANQTDLDETVSFVNRLQRKKAYKVGDIVYSSKLPSWAYLECTQAGTTAATEPNLSTISGGVEVNDGSVKWTVKTVTAKEYVDKKTKDNKDYIDTKINNCEQKQTVKTINVHVENQYVENMSCIQIGRVVQVSFDLKKSDESGGTALIASGLPHAVVDFIFSEVIHGDEGGSIRFKMMENGELRFHYPILYTATLGHEFATEFTYLTNN